MNRNISRIPLLLTLIAYPSAGQRNATVTSDPNPPLRLGIAGLDHDHVDGFFRGMSGRTDVLVVGIWDPSPELRQKYARKYGFAPEVFFTGLEQMLDRAKPEAVATFTSTAEHPTVVEAAANRHINVMMEKPLAVSATEANRIAAAARRSGIQVIVNYETTWYRSHGAMYQAIKRRGEAGEIRKMIAMDGHEGPREIGVSPAFLNWLTDPVKNGAGALFDFGCYGANLMTWMMDNARPVAVTATLSSFKPGVYPGVDDEADVLVEYPGAIGVIQGSWNWPYSRKDFEVYGEHGYAYAIGGDVLRTRLGSAAKEQVQSLEELPEDVANSISYLKAIVRRHKPVSGLSSLENNLIVVEILGAARESAKSGRRVALPKL